MKVSFFVCIKMVVISSIEALKLRELVFPYFVMMNPMTALGTKSYILWILVILMHHLQGYKQVSYIRPCQAWALLFLSIFMWSLLCIFFFFFFQLFKNSLNYSWIVLIFFKKLLLVTLNQIAGFSSQPYL